MRWIFLIILLVILVFIQITFLPLVTPWLPRPDPLLVVVAMVGLLAGPKAGSTLGFFYGLSSDLIAGGTMGYGAFSRMLVGGLTGKIGQHLYPDNAFVVVMSTSVATILGEVLFLAFKAPLSFFHGGLTHDVVTIVGEMVFNLLFALVVYHPFYKLWRWLAPEKDRLRGD